MNESLFAVMMVCALSLFGVLTLNLGGVVSIGIGWVRITFRRDRREAKPVDHPEERPDGPR